MVRKITEKLHDDTTRYMELACTSSDTKPTENVTTGSICVEVDTGNIYLYDEDGAQWVENGSLQG